MQLIKIDKARYRRHLNWVIAACIVTLAIGSLGIAQLLIALFPDESGSHFHWNLLGVISSAIVIGLLLNKYRTHDFMSEVVYVWELKQALNRINRKSAKIRDAAQKGNADAILSLHFSCAGSRLLWQLDDNTILMDELAVEQAKVDSLASEFNVNLDLEKYDDGLLQQF